MKKFLKQVLLTIVVVLVVLALLILGGLFYYKQQRAKAFHEQFLNGKEELVLGNAYEYKEGIELTIQKVEVVEKSYDDFVVKFHFDVNNKKGEDVDVDRDMARFEWGDLGILDGTVIVQYGIGFNDLYDADGRKIEVLAPGATKGCVATVSQFQRDIVAGSEELHGEILALGNISLGNKIYYIDFGKILEDIAK